MKLVAWAIKSSREAAPQCIVRAFSVESVLWSHPTQAIVFLLWNKSKLKILKENQSIILMPFEDALRFLIGNQDAPPRGPVGGH